ncbi:hypothetical protein ZIOFF_054368 [Zingiber officinale]|uniref:Myb/SANT-like domain-containing protein n=1 Tax=Zingiber officinale TaxID=94328 RepID=A0A8J5FJZ1_ZINOF|nr:hypothetical protein ZIOFF_054368 [Zingiber officinale]
MKREYMKWAARMDEAFIEALLNQHYQGFREKSDAIKWKTKVVSNYNNLEEFFAKDRATREGVETAKEKCKRWINETNGVQVESIIDIDRMVCEKEISLEDFSYSGKDLDAPYSKYSDKKNQGSTNSQRKKKKVSNDKELEVLKFALDNVAEAIRERNFILQNSRTRVYTENEIFNELIAIGVEENQIDDCYIFLTKNLDKARTFFGCPTERRKNILDKLMFDSHS